MNSGKPTYPIHEVFATFQGEGEHMGMPAFFVRTYGCPVRCPWCDSAGTWHPDYVPNITRYTAEEIVVMARQSGMHRIVITGGEPTVFDLTPLTTALHNAGKSVYLETSGILPIKGSFEWVTVSPKQWHLPIPSAIARADEFKFIIERPEDIMGYWTVIQPHMAGERSVWLHPEWGHRQDDMVLAAICEAVLKGQGRFRAGWQIHKLYQVDRMDARSKLPVPLGGNPAKGF